MSRLSEASRVRLILSAAAALLLVMLPAAAPAHARGGGEKAFTFADPRVIESSGLGASRLHPGIVYTFNDSGHTPQLFAVGPDGRTKATLTLAGARNRDWEAMAVGPDGLYVGDIGDNGNGQWPYVTVYRVPEPRTLRSQTLSATAYRLKYADGPRNAEAMMIDPRSGRLYIASKEFGGSLYQGPRRLRTGGFNVMRRVGDAPLYATDAAYAPDGRSFVIRTYWDADIYSAPGKELAHVQIPSQKQGEGIAYATDGRSLLLSSEGGRQAVWRVPVPEQARPPVPAPTHSTVAGTRNGSGGGSAFLGALIVGGLVLAGVVVFARRRAS